MLLFYNFYAITIPAKFFHFKLQLLLFFGTKCVIDDGYNFWPSSAISLFALYIKIMFFKIIILNSVRYVTILCTLRQNFYWAYLYIGSIKEDYPNFFDNHNHNQKLWKSIYDQLKAHFGSIQEVSCLIEKSQFLQCTLRHRPKIQYFKGWNFFLNQFFFIGY